MTDTGPPYPFINPTGSNSIGEFTIGVSPIGDIPAFNAYTTVIAQYSNSPTIDGIVNSFDAAMDLTELLDDFFDDVVNPDTAVGYGLDVIGRIVNVSRTLPLPSGASYLGFEEAGSSWTGFGQGGFFGGGSVTSNFVLADDDYRLLIFAKMLGNISDGSIPSLNSILLTLFPGRGPCYVVDNLDMSMVFFFSFALNPVELAIVQESGVLPVPAGIAVSITS